MASNEVPRTTHVNTLFHNISSQNYTRVDFVQEMSCNGHMLMV